MNTEKKCIACAASLLCATGLGMMVGACMVCGTPMVVHIWSEALVPTGALVPKRWRRSYIEDYPSVVLFDIVHCDKRIADGADGPCRVYDISQGNCVKCEGDKETEVLGAQ